MNMSSIYELIPDHELLLSLEPEELAGVILEYLHSLPAIHIVIETFQSLTSSGWEIVLAKSEEQGRHHESRFGELTGDQLAELRAKRILLNQKLGVASPWLFEYQIRNGISQQYKNGLVVHESPSHNFTRNLSSY